MVLVAVLLARFTWSLINPAEPDDSAVLPIVTVDSTATGSMNLETLTTLNLSSSRAGNRPKSVQNAPKTSLNVRLIGVSASSNPERSAAIIQQGSKQQTYIIGESPAVHR